MAKPKGRKLKVFQARFGFYDSVVAAPSQAAALLAWGLRQNLFANGEAKVITNQAAVAVATAQPLTPLFRAVGSTDSFVLKPTNLPKVPDVVSKPSPHWAPKAKPFAAQEPPADRTKLDAAEKSLRALDERRKIEEGDFRQQADDLDARRAASQNHYVAARKAATAKVMSARTAYRKAGGQD